MEIIRADLLSIEEYRKNKEIIWNSCQFENNWWLRDPGTSYSLIAYVDFIGLEHPYGLIGNKNELAVRPALYLEEGQDIKIGKSFNFGGAEFIIIDNNLALCKDKIGVNMFYEEEEKGDVDYENSFVKGIIKNWFEENKMSLLEEENKNDEES